MKRFAVLLFCFAICNPSHAQSPNLVVSAGSTWAGIEPYCHQR